MKEHARKKKKAVLVQGKAYTSGRTKGNIKSFDTEKEEEENVNKYIFIVIELKMFIQIIQNGTPGFFSYKHFLFHHSPAPHLKYKFALAFGFLFELHIFFLPFSKSEQSNQFFFSIAYKSVNSNSRHPHTDTLAKTLCRK